MRDLQQTILAGLQSEDAPAYAHRREALRLLLSRLLEEVHSVIELDSSRENTSAQRLARADGRHAGERVRPGNDGRKRELRRELRRDS